MFIIHNHEAPRGGGGGGGNQQSFLRGGSPLRGLNIPFLRQKRYPFIVFPITYKWYLFHISSLEFGIPFNCCKYTVFEI